MRLATDKILAWFITWALGIFLSVFTWMAKSIYDISTNLTVVVYQIKDHTERITSLEDWRNGHGKK